MDIDVIMKSSTEDQMDFTTMMMQMEKLPQDFSPLHHSNNFPTIPELEFSDSAIGMTPPSIIQNTNPNAASTSPSLMNQPQNTIPFMATPAPFQERFRPVQEQFIPVQESFKSGSGAFTSHYDKRNSVAAMREMIFRIAVMQPVHIDPESIKPPKRRNVRISKDPQSVAARHRRERISERIRILQRLVPGGTKMDTASMLDEAIHYVKFLKKQVQTLEQAGTNRSMDGVGFPGTAVVSGNQSCFLKGAQCGGQMVGSMQMLR